MESLYVLELEEGKYYVGKTTDIKKRLQQHASGHGSDWTYVYRPIKVVEYRPLKDEHDETNTTKDLMKKYGIENVRGGAYTATTLTPEQTAFIRHELHATSDACYKCGQRGHFANRCPTKEKKEEVLWGCSYCDRTFSTEYGCSVHERSCKPPTPPRKSLPGNCYRCGRKGHWASSCYAKTDVRGNELESDDSDYNSE